MKQFPRDLEGDEGLARAGGEREEDSLLIARNGLHHALDGDVLIIAPLPGAALVLKRTGGKAVSPDGAGSIGLCITEKGRSKVSHMANKKLKTNLHMGSLSSVRLDEGLKAYYERKVAEGKNKLSVLNAVKNKLIARVIAVVKRERPYEKNYNTNALVLS